MPSILYSKLCSIFRYSPLHRHIFLAVALRFIGKGHLQHPKVQQKFKILLREMFEILKTTVLHNPRFGAQFRSKNKDTLKQGIM